MYSHVDAIEVSIWGRHVGTIVPKRREPNAELLGGEKSFC